MHIRACAVLACVFGVLTSHAVHGLDLTASEPLDATIERSLKASELAGFITSQGFDAAQMQHVNWAVESHVVRIELKAGDQATTALDGSTATSAAMRVLVLHITPDAVVNVCTTADCDGDRQLHLKGVVISRGLSWPALTEHKDVYVGKNCGFHRWSYKCREKYEGRDDPRGLNAAEATQIVESLLTSVNARRAQIGL